MEIKFWCALTASLSVILPNFAESGRTDLNQHGRRLTIANEIQCDFSRHTCGIRNQQNIIGSRFNHVPDLHNCGLPLAGKRGYLILNATESSGYGARLITPYFKISHQNHFGCFQMEYLFSGPGIRSLFLIQQDKRNHCIFQMHNNYNAVPQSVANWRNVSVTVDLSCGPPRFFIEAHLARNSGHKCGFLAINQINFNYGQCERVDGKS